MNRGADLHCHTTASDGSESPEAIIELAVSQKLEGLSITDHDTIAAYETAVERAHQLNLPLLSGLELSTVYGKESIHILAYGFPLKSELIHDLCLSQEKMRNDRNRLILQKIKEHGINIAESELDEFPGVKGRPHIALLLQRKGIVDSVKQAFDEYLGEGKPFYTPGRRMEVVEAIGLIQAAKGKAILAHPHLINEKRTLKALFSMPFDGIEGYYAMMPETRCHSFLAIAKQKGWIVTGGSDYHGEVKPQIQLGSSWTPASTFNILYEHYLQVQSTS